MTLRHIADSVGCAVSAVSTVLNGAGGNTGVSAELRQRIEDCAAELGYQVNYHASALRRGLSATIGLVYSPGDGSAVHARFFAPLMAGVEDQVRTAGSDVLIVGPSQTESELQRGLRYWQQRRLDALVLPGMMYGGSMDEISRSEALIAIALSLGPVSHPLVSIEEAPGIEDAVRHLVDLGHRQLTWVGVRRAGVKQTPERTAVLRAAAARAGLALDHVSVDLEPSQSLGSVGDWVSASQGRFAGHLRGGARPTAVIAYNELVALGVYGALAELGLRVPGDVSVVGFDDITADVAVPSMTVVDLRLREVGQQAAALALEMASDPEASRRLAGREVPIPARLVVRESTCPVRGA